MLLLAQHVLPLLLAASPAPAQVAAPTWVHVRVNGKDAKEVSLDLPLAAARVALDLASQQAVAGGRLKVHDVDVSLLELRAAWKTVRALGGPLVTVKEADQTVRIGLVGDAVKINVSGAGEDVNVEVPARVVDALLAGEGDTLQLAAALDAITRHGAGDIVRVTDRDQKIRVWID